MAQGSFKMQGFLESGLNGPTWAQFCERVEGAQSDEDSDSDPQWSDHLTLVAAANVYQRSIRVLFGGGAQPVDIFPSARTGNHQHKPLLLLLLGETHYMSIEPDDKDTQPEPLH